jgi:toxin ParE1/3/4
MNPMRTRFIDLLVRRFEMLSGNPYLGRSRDELRVGYRSFPVGQYIAFYRIVTAIETEPCVEIMHVIQGKRDIDALIWNR